MRIFWLTFFSLQLYGLNTLNLITRLQIQIRLLTVANKLNVEKYLGNFRMEICSKSAFSAKRARFHKLPTFPQQGNSMPLFQSFAKHKCSEVKISKSNTND